MNEDRKFEAVISRLADITGNEAGAKKWMNMWLEPHRYYHNFSHFIDLCNKVPDHTREDIFLAITFHDIIYDPRRADNEERSAEFFLSEMTDEFKKNNEQLVDDVFKAIMDTKHQEPPKSKLGEILCKADMSILFDSDLNELVNYEIGISKEYQLYPYDLYREGRVHFLKKWVDRNVNINGLIDFISHRRMKIGIYAGSFDPFTIGHMNILQKAERMFDKVIIARGLNPAKNKWAYKLPPSLDYHQKVWIGVKHNGEKNQSVRPIGSELYETGCYPHLANMMSEHNGTVLVRGLRGASDLEAERTQQIYVEKMLNGPLDTMYITCDREYDHISSSAFRQLLKVDESTAVSCCPNGMPETC